MNVHIVSLKFLGLGEVPTAVRKHLCLSIKTNL